MLKAATAATATAEIAVDRVGADEEEGVQAGASEPEVIYVPVQAKPCVVTTTFRLQPLKVETAVDPSVKDAEERTPLVTCAVPG